MENELIELIANLKLDEAEAQAQKLLEDGIETSLLYDLVMEGLEQIGEKYKNSECFIADLIVSGMMAKSIFSFANDGQKPQTSQKLGTVLIGTIYDDIHDIGKDLMIDALKNKGIDTIDLGVDVKVASFVEAVEENRPDIIAVSCVMTSSIPYLQELGEALEAKKLLTNCRFLLGGAVVNHGYIKIPQVDFMSNNFYEGIQYCENYLKTKKERQDHE